MTAGKLMLKMLKRLLVKLNRLSKTQSVLPNRLSLRHKTLNRTRRRQLMRLLKPQMKRMLLQM